MSLLHLLTAGKSLVGLKKSEIRYHLPKTESLPKFGSKKNPFRATSLPDKVEATEQKENEEKAFSTAVPPSKEAGVQPSAGVCSQTSFAATRTPSKEAAVKESPQPLGGAGRPASAVKALLLRGRARKAKPLFAQPGRPLVQAELSLDRVKVVRNDLSECDLEVVRASQSAAATHAKRRSDAEPGTSNLLQGWGAAAGRLFGMGT